MYRKILHPIHCWVKKFDWLCIALLSSWCLCISFLCTPLSLVFVGRSSRASFPDCYSQLSLSLSSFEMFLPSQIFSLFAYLYHKFSWRHENLKSRGKWVTKFWGERAFPCLLLSLPSCLFSLPLLFSIEKSKSWNLPRKVSLIHPMQSNYKRDQRSLLLLELDEEEGMPMLTSLSLFSCVLSCGWFLSSSLCLLPLGSWRGCRKKGRRCCDDFPSRMQGILLPESFIFAFMSFTFSRLWIV